jgi:hypothetical protein
MSEAQEAKVPKVKDIQNGVTRPGAGTTTARIWEIADMVSAQSGAFAKRGEVLKIAEAEGLNLTTAATQFGHWCKYNGVVPAPKEAKAPKAPKEPKAPRAKKEKNAPAPAEPVAA